MTEFPRFGRLLLGGGMAVALASQAAAAPTTKSYLDCTPKNREVCRSGKPCVRSAPETMIFKVHPGRATYSRCEPGRTEGSLLCESYPVQIFAQGAGVTIAPDQGSFFVQVKQDLWFTEVIGYGDRVEITRGTCQIAPPTIDLTPM